MFSQRQRQTEHVKGFPKLSEEARGAGVDHHASSKEHWRVDPAKKKEGLDGPVQSWDMWTLQGEVLAKNPTLTGSQSWVAGQESATSHCLAHSSTFVGLQETFGILIQVGRFSTVLYFS